MNSLSGRHFGKIKKKSIFNFWTSNFSFRVLFRENNKTYKIIYYRINYNLKVTYNKEKFNLNVQQYGIGEINLLVHPCKDILFNYKFFKINITIWENVLTILLNWKN